MTPEEVIVDVANYVPTVRIKYVHTRRLSYVIKFKVYRFGAIVDTVIDGRDKVELINKMAIAISMDTANLSKKYFNLWCSANPMSDKETLKSAFALNVKLYVQNNDTKLKQHLHALISDAVNNKKALNDSAQLAFALSRKFGLTINDSVRIKRLVHFKLSMESLMT